MPHEPKTPLSAPPARRPVALHASSAAAGGSAEHGTAGDDDPDAGWRNSADAALRIHVLRAELRAAIVGSVGRLRDAGEPPERVLVFVKATVGAAARTNLPSREAEHLVTQSSQWVIDTYFRRG